MLVYLGPLTLGLILALLGLGVYISYRIFNFPDITVDGSFSSGGVVALMAIKNGTDPVSATLLGVLAGMIAGAVTGLLQTRLQVNKILSGIIVMTGLYSANYFLMDSSAVVLIDEASLKTQAADIGAALFSESTLAALKQAVLPAEDLVFAAMVLCIVAAVSFALYAFLRTNIGLALRASGENERMVRALGVNTNLTVLIGLAISNGLVAAAGALYAQDVNTADLTTGVGFIAVGLTSVIVGQVIAGRGRLARALASVVLASVIVRYLVAALLALGVETDYFKLINATFLVLVLWLPDVLRRRAR